MIDDPELLRQYVERRSEAAFATLVERHLPLVYSAAFRRLQNHELARDVSQAVFLLLAQKAASLDSKTALVGWLYQTASFKAARLSRSETRRRIREQEAAHMSEPTHASQNLWESLAPLLDDAMDELNARERLAILLRFFQGKSFREIGHLLEIEEDAARMRVNRSLEKLRESFARKGMTCSCAALASLLAERAVEAAPPAIAAAIQQAAKTSAPVNSWPIFPSIGSLILFMTRTKLKLAGIISVMVMLFIGSFLIMKKPPESNSASPVAVQALAASRDIPAGRLAKRAVARGAAVVPPENANPEIAAKLRTFRKLIFTPLRDSATPENLLYRAIYALAPDFHLMVPTLLDGLQSTNSFVQNRSRKVLEDMVLMVHRGAYADVDWDGQKLRGWVPLNTEPLATAIQAISPQLQEMTRTETNSQVLEVILAALQVGSGVEPVPNVIEKLKQGNLREVGPKGLDILLAHPEESRGLLTPMLHGPDAREQLVAAYVLAVMPGVKPAEVQDVLIRSLGSDLNQDEICLTAIASLGPGSTNLTAALLGRQMEILGRNPDIRAQLYSTLDLLDPTLKQSEPEVARWVAENSGNKQQDQAQPATPDSPEPPRVARMFLAPVFHDILDRVEAEAPDHMDEVVTVLNSRSTDSGFGLNDFVQLAEKLEKIDPSVRDVFAASVSRKFPQFSGVLTRKINP